MIRRKLLKWLFGWDYISWKNSADQGIAIVRKDQNGVVYYFRYSVTRLVDIIREPNQVIWLTCSPTKFFDK